MKSIRRGGRVVALILATVLVAAVPSLPSYAATPGQTANSDNAGSNHAAPGTPYGYGPGGYGGYGMGPGMMYGYGGYGMGPGMMYGYGGSPAGFGGVLWMIVAWGIPLLLLFFLARYVFNRMGNGHGQKDAPTGRTALDILKESYARGEIEREEYLRKRDDLLEK